MFTVVETSGNLVTYEEYYRIHTLILLSYEFSVLMLIHSYVKVSVLACDVLRFHEAHQFVYKE